MNMRDMPGVKRDNVEITVANGRLTIKGERRFEEEKKDGNYLLREMSYGSFCRTVRVPDDLDAERAVATMEDGVLTLTMPHMPGAAPRTINVR